MVYEIKASGSVAVHQFTQANEARTLLYVKMHAQIYPILTFRWLAWNKFEAFHDFRH